MTTTPQNGERYDALIAALIELERHVMADGWDQPPRLFALVHTDDVVAAEPQLAADLGLRGAADGGPADALTAIEQEQFATGDQILTDLSGIEWPETVFWVRAGDGADLPARRRGTGPPSRSW
jgi:hypothetical protein